MKTVFILLFLFVSKVFGQIVPVSSKPSKNPSLELIIDSSQFTPFSTSNSAKSDTSRLKEICSYLCSGKARNYLNTDRLNEIANRLKTELSLYADTVYFQAYFVKGVEYKNVVALFNTSKTERVVVGAHYDVCGYQNGADDNASGVAALLELARLSKGKTLPHCLELVAYALEEPPYFHTEFMGSVVHAKSLKSKNIAVKGMISIEMIGFYSDEKKSQKYPIKLLKWFYGDKANYISIVNKMNKGSFCKQLVRSMKSNCVTEAKAISAPKKITGIDYSDHSSYWEEGYDALMITDTSFYRNSNYHQKTDTIETLNFRKMAEVCDGILMSID